MVNPLTALEASKNVILLGVAIWGNDQRDVLTDGFISGVAKNAFCTLVPSGNNAVKCLADDGIIGRSDNGS
jgi:hypothetical protein